MTPQECFQDLGTSGKAQHQACPVSRPSGCGSCSISSTFWNSAVCQREPQPWVVELELESGSSGCWPSAPWVEPSVSPIQRRCTWDRRAVTQWRSALVWWDCPLGTLSIVVGHPEGTRNWVIGNLALLQSCSEAPTVVIVVESLSRVSEYLRCHGLQPTSFPCPSVSSRVCSDSRPLSQWCYITISYCPLLLPSIFASIRVFSNESALRIRWPKYRSFSFCISPSSEHSGLISFRMGWFELLAVQGKTLKSLLQHNLYCVHATLVYLLLCLCSG